MGDLLLKHMNDSCGAREIYGFFLMRVYPVANLFYYTMCLGEHLMQGPVPGISLQANPLSSRGSPSMHPRSHQSGKLQVENCNGNVAPSKHATQVLIKR